MSVIFPRSIIPLCGRIRFSSAFFGTSVLRKFSVVPELTRIRYPDVQRGNYGKLQEDDVLAFKRILDQNRVITEESDLEGKYVHRFLIFQVVYIIRLVFRIYILLYYH